jgi:hypothetical protein
MRTIRSTLRRLLSLRRDTTLALPVALASALAFLSLSACTDELLSPTAGDLAQLRTADLVVQRPFEYSQAWDASGNDFTNPCIVDIPDPAAPGGSVQLAFPGLTHGWGTATHWGRHSVDIYVDHCGWDAQAGAISIGGPAEIVVANGDTIRGTYGGYLVPSLAGADFTGALVLLGGTGRFQNVTGEASLYAHDELDGSGRDWGSGWIAY